MTRSSQGNVSRCDVSHIQRGVFCGPYVFCVVFFFFLSLETEAPEAVNDRAVSQKEPGSQTTSWNTVIRMLTRNANISLLQA